jgi:hypothetical protein
MEVFMNYIELINNFWIANRVHSFNSLETSLYFFILDYANNARWPGSFNLPNGIIQSVYECTKGQLGRARKRLCEAGLINYEAGDRFNPGKYTILAFPTDPRYVPDASPKDTPTGARKRTLESAVRAGENAIVESAALPDESPARSRCVPDTFSTDPSNINKTKLKKRKQKITELPYGNSSARLTGEGRISGEESVIESLAVTDGESQAMDNSRANVSYESIGNDRIEEIDPAVQVLRVQAVEMPPGEADGAVPYELIRRAFIDLCPSLPAPKESGFWSQARKRLIRCRWKDYPSLEFWEDYFNRVESSDFLSGRVTRWRADFDWIMKPSNFEKVLEGKYANRQEKVAEVLRQFVEAG